MSPFHFAELIEVFVDVELDFLVGDGGSGSAFAASPSAFLLISTMATSVGCKTPAARAKGPQVIEPPPPPPPKTGVPCERVVGRGGREMCVCVRALPRPGYPPPKTNPGATGRLHPHNARTARGGGCVFRLRSMATNAHDPFCVFI